MDYSESEKELINQVGWQIFELNYWELFQTNFETGTGNNSPAFFSKFEKGKINKVSQVHTLKVVWTLKKN